VIKATPLEGGGAKLRAAIAKELPKQITHAFGEMMLKGFL